MSALYAGPRFAVRVFLLALRLVSVQYAWGREQASKARLSDECAAGVRVK